MITTPNDTHKDVIVQALEAGKAVYTDKPIAHTLEDANEIAAAVRATGAVFAVGHSSRRLSGHREMKRWISDGRLGEMSLAEANFSNERGLELTPQTWRFYADKSPGGAFIQLGVHHADTLQFLLGPVKNVTAHARKLYTSREVPDAIMAILEFESGALGYIGTGWASPGVYRMNLLGTKANLMYDLDFTHWDESHLADDWSTLKSQFYGESERQAVELPRTDMFREQLEEFGLAARGQATVEVGRRRGGSRPGRCPGGDRVVETQWRSRPRCRRSSTDAQVRPASRNRPTLRRGSNARHPLPTCSASLDLPGRRSADPVPDGHGGDYSVRIVSVPPGPRNPHRHPATDEVTYVAVGPGRRLGGR